MMRSASARSSMAGSPSVRSMRAVSGVGELAKVTGAWPRTVDPPALTSTTTHPGRSGPAVVSTSIMYPPSALELRRFGSPVMVQLISAGQAVTSARRTGVPEESITVPVTRAARSYLTGGGGVVGGVDGEGGGGTAVLHAHSVTTQSIQRMRPTNAGVMHRYRSPVRRRITGQTRIARSDCRRDPAIESACLPGQLPFRFENGGLPF